MDGDFIIFFGILFLLYSSGSISLTQLLILLSLISTVYCCDYRTNDNTNT